MTDPTVQTVFSLLDRWRHFPAYQLERRADVFFGLFLKDVLDDYLRPMGLSVDPRLIPEFPLRQKSSNRSDKADYFALAMNPRTGEQAAFLVELKTDIRSARDPQKEYLERASRCGMAKVLSDLKPLFKATTPHLRGKYFHLLTALAELGLVAPLPTKLKEKVYGPSRGITKCIDDIELASSLPPLKVLFVLPEETGEPNYIGFERIAGVVEDSGEFGRCFATHLRKWVCETAGSRPR